MQGTKREVGPQQGYAGGVQATKATLRNRLDLAVAEGFGHQPVGEVVDQSGVGRRSFVARRQSSGSRACPAQLASSSENPAILVSMISIRRAKPSRL